MTGQHRPAPVYDDRTDGVPRAEGLRVAFCVESTTPSVDDEPGTLAAGLARALRDYGWDAFCVPQESWRDVGQELDVIVACSSRYTPVDTPGGPVLLGWAGEVASWAARPDLAAYDGLLAPSRLGADRLAREFTGPICVLLPAVDPTLCPNGERVAVRRGTLGGPNGGRRGVERVPPLRRYGEVIAALCPSSPGHREFGVVPLRLLHAVAAGALPVATSRLGLADLDLTDVDVALDTAAVGDALDSAAQQPAVSAARAQRMRNAVWAGHTWRHRLAAFAAAVEEARQARTAVRGTVGFFPNYPENPYQQMLYADSVASGFRIVPLPDPIASPVVRDDGKSLEGQILHIQWTAPLLQVASGPLDAARRLEAFKESVTRFRERGGRVLWTIHNVLPHEVRYLMAEIELCEFLARSSDRIHVLGDETVAAAKPYYDLPVDKLALVPLASFLDIYPDFVGREEARRRLGLLDEEIALLLFGVIRPYKGLDMLLEVFDRALASDPRLRLLVAGRPSASPRVDIWRERCSAHPRVVSALRFIDDAEVQIWMRASDLVVLPYQSILNSAALQLAVAFGLPVVGPIDGVVASQLDPSFAATFRPGDADDLLRAIQDGVKRLLTPQASAAALAAARSYTPIQMSREFTQVVTTLAG